MLVPFWESYPPAELPVNGICARAVGFRGGNFWFRIGELPRWMSRLGSVPAIDHSPQYHSHSLTDEGLARCRSIYQRVPNSTGRRNSRKTAYREASVAGVTRGKIDQDPAA